jgi:hypothetical protein
MSGGETFATQLVHVAILLGTPTEANGAPLEGGVGRLFRGRDRVHGWYFLNSNTYTALWDQIGSGAYADCTIELCVTPVDWDEDPPVWNTDQPLLIENATIHFKRTTGVPPNDDPPKRKGFFR